MEEDVMSMNPKKGLNGVNDAPMHTMLLLRVRKNVLADIICSIVFVLIELSLLAALMHLGLLSPQTSLRLPSDYLNYEPMARSLFSTAPAAHNAPFCWRVLTPWLVFGLTQLGVSLQNGFLLVSVFGLCGAIICVYVLLRIFGATLWQALAITLLFQAQYVVGLLGLWDYERTDPLSYFLLALAFMLYWRNHPRWLIVVLSLAALNRETALFAVAAFAGEQIVHRDWQRLKAYLPAYIAPILILLILHVAIYQVGTYNVFREIGYSWTERTNLVGRGSTQMAVGNVNVYALNLYHLTINAYGLLLPLLLLQFIHPPCIARRPEAWIFLLLTAIQVVFATDDERLMFIAFPIVAIAAWHELRWLAQRVKLPVAAIAFPLVAVQAFFLLGQFYKTIQDFSLNKVNTPQEPHWLNLLWLGTLLLLIITMLGAICVVLGYGIRRFPRASRSRQESVREHFAGMQRGK